MLDRMTFQKTVLEFFRGLGASAVLWLVMMLLLVACRSHPEPVDPMGEKQHISANGVQLTVTTSAQEIATSDMLEVTVRVSHDPNYQVELPEVPARMGVFFVFESRNEPARLDENGWVSMTRTYLLEPDMPGECVLPGFKVTAKNAQEEDGLLLSKPIIVKVSSVLAEKEGSAGTSLRDIAPDERAEIVTPVSQWPVNIVIANILIVVVLFMLLLKWVKRDAVDNTQAMSDFALLSDVSSTEIMQCLEPAASKLIAQHYSLNLDSVDFAGLVKQLHSHAVAVPGLVDAVVAYEKLQYASGQPSQTDAREIYTTFHTLIASLNGKGDTT